MSTDSGAATPQKPADDVALLQRTLEQRLIGVQMRNLSCGCGQIHCAAGKITAIEAPAEASDAGRTFLWSARVTPTEPGHSEWNTSLPLDKADEQQIFEAALAGQTAVREALKVSLENYLVGRREFGDPDNGFGAGEIIGVRCTQWQSSHAAHLWEALVQADEGPRPQWSFTLADHLFSARTFAAVREKLEQRLQAGEGPPQPLTAVEVQDTIDSTESQMSADVERTTHKLRSRLVGQSHAGYTDINAGFAPGRITDVVCTNREFPRQIDNWKVRVTPSDPDVAPWLMRIKHVLHQGTFDLVVGNMTLGASITRKLLG